MCPKSYDYHYNQRIRPNTTSGALLFGSALDSALNVLLMEPDKSAEDAFDQAFSEQPINGEATFIPTSTAVVYANSDFDSDLLYEEDISTIKEKFECADILSNHNALRKKKSDSGFDSLTAAEKSQYNFLIWLSMRRKGHLMLAAYRKKVLPKLTEVHEVQKAIDLKNDDGDSVVGFIDLIADVKGFGTVVLDNKTSSRDYEPDSVVTSPQLSLYTHAVSDEYKTRKAGYIVLKKQLIKNRKKICSKCGNNGSGARHKTCDALVGDSRCHGEWTETVDPDVFVQIIIDDIPEKLEQIVLQNVDDVNRAIKSGIFTRNFASCANWYGGDCSYKKLCFENNMKGLCKTGDKNGK